MKKNILLFLLIPFVDTGNAQTYNAGDVFAGYADINPDTLLNYTVAPYTHETFGLNVFGSPNALEFVAHGAVSPGGTGAYINVNPLNPFVHLLLGRLDSVYVPGSMSWNVTRVAKPLSMGDSLDPAAAVWENELMYFTDHSGAGGGVKDVNDWIGGERYLALKYMDGSDVRYGWVRVECVAEDSCYLKDLSFTTGSVAVSEAMKERLKAYPNPLHDHLFLKDLPPDALIILRDIYGNAVSFHSRESDQGLRIDLDPGLPAGCYLLQCLSGDGVFYKKVMKD